MPPILRLLPAFLLVAGAAPLDAQAQRPGAVVEGRVLDALHGAPVAGASVVVRYPPPSAVVRHTLTDSSGRYRVAALPRGAYTLEVERFGYRRTAIEVTVGDDEALTLSILLQPLALRIPGLALHAARDTLPRDSASASRNAASATARALLARQDAFLSGDVHVLGSSDLRNANTIAEDDVFRALHALPGVARRDDYTADLWTRGAAEGHTAVAFDGVPVLGALHALGALSGLNSDLLAATTFQPGVAGAASQGAGAAIIDLRTRSTLGGSPVTELSLSPLSVRASTRGRVGSHFGWAVGARRSHLDLLASLTDALTPGDGAFRYAFADVTARADVRMSTQTSLEVSGFYQDDRIFGDVADIAPGNTGSWGARVARASLHTRRNGIGIESTIGISTFDASLRAAPSDRQAPLHEPTENHHRTLLWRVALSPAGEVRGWSAGLEARHERLRYDGPDVDRAGLLTADELARRGVIGLLPTSIDIERARRTGHQQALRLAGWGGHRGIVARDVELDAGLRVETGSRVGGSRIRLAPRAMMRYRRAAAPWSISAGLGRAWQYTQSIARTDVLRPGLRLSEVMVQADAATPALRSDVATLGAEVWHGTAWLAGITGWWRASDGLLLQLTAPGPLDRRGVTEDAEVSGRGVELSLRRVEGPLRGFANYALSRVQQRAGTYVFAAPQDRRHVANVGMTATLSQSWRAGGTFRYESGAPYTRITVVSTPCDGTACDDTAPLMLGGIAAQRGADYASLDLMAAWTYARPSWSLSIDAQLRNALGRSNAVTYHSSCLCVGDDAGDDTWLGDTFDPGLPRLPVIAVRVRF